MWRISNTEAVIFLLNIQLDPCAQRAVVQVHRLNQCPVYRSVNKAGPLDWRRHMKIIVDEAGEIIAKATDDHTLIGGHHRLAVAASLGKRVFWRDTGEPVKLDLLASWKFCSTYSPSRSPNVPIFAH